MATKLIHGKTVENWYSELPILRDLIDYTPTYYRNTALRQVREVLEKGPIDTTIIDDAAARLDRFRPFIAARFPETSDADGLIESQIIPIPAMQAQLAKENSFPLPGKLLLKCDHALPISGSVKARGGIYEVLKVAETLAFENDLLGPDDDYAKLADKSFIDFFGNYSIAVGSTGNLGMSIGIMGAAFGFQVTVHMSAEAKAWKKKLLREHGVRVEEHSGDYGKAVIAGRKEAKSDSNCHFVDDENSLDLFAGYSVAAGRLKAQLDSMEVIVDENNPLFVYLPCGVGGAPGGIAFGLKHTFGDHVHCFFAEPTHSPCMLLGLLTDLHNEVSVNDFGLDNLTAADGLAVGRASGLVGRAVGPLIRGVFSVDDQRLYALLAMLADTEKIFMEPSALAGLACLAHPDTARMLAEYPPGIVSNATHIAWATGGSMVPQEEMQAYYRKGKNSSC